jgi:hypothetical protein
MKMKILIATLALAAGVGSAGAQTQYATETGRVIAGPLFDGGLRTLFSGQDNIYGTSRSAAMGGAFTSLGADLSTMSINPAGLGMYQSSDWGFTTALSIDGMQTASPNMRAGALAEGGSRTSLGLNNVGAAYNIYTGSGALTSLTFGFTYNRAANFNSRTRIDTFGEDVSIADMFVRQLEYYDIPSGDLEPNANPFEYLDFEWFGAALGYQTGMVGAGDSGGYGTTPLDSYFGSVTKGGIYEYDFSLGANIENVLYLGATLGMTDISYSESTSYEEHYGQNWSMWYDQNTVIKGSGFSAKLGAILRPVEALRIGVAFHLPTYYTLDKTYDAAMGAEWRADTGIPLVSTSHFNTAPRLLTGISGVIANRAILALDWEMTWYDRIRLRNDSQSNIQSSINESQSNYNPAHTFRAGFEYLLSDVVSLRAGGSYMPDFMRDKGFVANNPTVKSSYSITGGLGFNIGRNGYLDMAYIYNRATMTDYDFFFFDDGDYPTGQYDVVGGNEIGRTYTPTRNRHMITLTLGNRF